VDRKASKGRKVRYNVHAKLQNFMFPMPTASAFETTGPQDADKLFQSLFQ
jgi:protein AATF/BFR2